MGWFCYLCERWHTFWCFSVIFTSLCQYMCLRLAWHTFYCIFWKMRLWVLFITGVSWLYLLIKFNQTFLFCFWNGWILFINEWIHVFIEFIKPLHTPTYNSLSILWMSDTQCSCMAWNSVDNYCQYHKITQIKDRNKVKKRAFCCFLQIRAIVLWKIDTQAGHTLLQSEVTRRALRGQALYILQKVYDGWDYPFKLTDQCKMSKFQGGPLGQ